MDHIASICEACQNVQNFLLHHMQLELLILANCLLFHQEYGWVFQNDMILNIPLITDMQLILGYQCR